MKSRFKELATAIDNYLLYHAQMGMLEVVSRCFFLDTLLKEINCAFHSSWQHGKFVVIPEIKKLVSDYILRGFSVRVELVPIKRIEHPNGNWELKDVPENAPNDGYLFSVWVERNDKKQKVEF